MSAPTVTLIGTSTEANGQFTIRPAAQIITEDGTEVPVETRTITLDEQGAIPDDTEIVMSTANVGEPVAYLVQQLWGTFIAGYVTIDDDPFDLFAADWQGYANPGSPTSYASQVALEQETADREAGDEDLQTQIDALPTAGDVSAEATARIAADTALASSVAAEVTARENALTAEVTRADAAYDHAGAASAAVTALVNGAPGLLDTLLEIDAAIGNDPNFATTLATALATKATPADITAAVNALAAVARSGQYADLTGKPTLGTAAAQNTSAFDAAGAAGSAQSAAIAAAATDATTKVNTEAAARAAADALLAPLASPSLTGTPTAPTAAPGTNTTQLANTAFVAAAVAALINASPGALDTLKELADAIGDDANYAATITTALALKAPLASPVLTGNPTAPTPTPGDNDTSIATTAFVQAALAAWLTDPGTAWSTGAASVSGQVWTYHGSRYVDVQGGNLPASPSTPRFIFTGIAVTGTPADGQTPIWSATNQQYELQSFGQIALTKITANVALTSTAHTAVAGLAVLVPAGTKAPYTVRARLPYVTITGNGSAAGNNWALKVELSDGTNECDYGEFNGVWSASSKTLGWQGISLERTFETDLAVDTTYAVNMWFTGVRSRPAIWLPGPESVRPSHRHSSKPSADMVRVAYPAPDGVHLLPSGENGLGILPNDWERAARRQMIVCLHGRTGGPFSFFPTVRGNVPSVGPVPGQPGYHPLRLAAQGGYGILAIDAGGPVSWGSLPQRIDDAVTYAMTSIASGGLGSTSSKVGIIAHSMGAMDFWVWSASGHADAVCAGAWVWCPATDLRAGALRAGYTPAYSTAYAASVFNGNTSGNVSGSSQVATELAAAYPSGYDSIDPMQNPSHWATVPYPVKVVTPSDDNVAGPGQGMALVAAINNPNITLRSPQPLGGHVQPWDGDLATGPVPTSEVIAFFDGLAW